MPEASKLSQASSAPKKAGGGLKKLAPPPGFKGKPRADNSMAASVDLLGGASGATAP